MSAPATSNRSDPGTAELRERFRQARRIRIVLLTGLGDVVHGLPVANAIRRAHPSCRITWVAEPMPAGLLVGHPAINRLIVFEKKRGLAGVRGLRTSLRGDDADITLNLNVYFKSVFPTIFSASPVRLGFDRARSHDGVWLFCNRHLEPRPRAHTQDMFLEFLERLGVPARPLEWRLEPTPAERTEQDAFLAAHGLNRSGATDRAAAIVTASANPKKDWVAERWVELADRLYLELGLRPLLIGGPGARETAIARRVIEQSRAPVINALGDGVRRLVWLIECSRLLIAPDTGPLHIARALGVPAVGLFGHTNPWRVGPYRKYEDLWIDRYTEPGAAPDPGNATPRLGRMELITVDDVLEKVQLALTRHDSPVAGAAGTGAHADLPQPR